MSYQFHWKNADYQSFEDYLARLSHKRRNQIKNERKKVAALGLQIQIFEGNAIQEEHLEALW